jgi:hypothetical protein
MSGFSDYSAQAAINYLLLDTPMPAIGGRFLALFTADPKDDNSGSGSEIAAGWYARQEADSWTAPVSNPDGVTGTTTSNSAQVTFPATTGSSVTVTHWGLYDAETGGNLLFSGALQTPRTLNVSDVMTLGANQLTMLFS